jgi:hypothetical protein
MHPHYYLKKTSLFKMFAHLNIFRVFSLNCDLINGLIFVVLAVAAPLGEDLASGRVVAGFALETVSSLQNPGTKFHARYKIYTQVQISNPDANFIPWYKFYTQVQSSYLGTNFITRYKFHTKEQISYPGTNFIPWYKISSHKIFCEREQSISSYPESVQELLHVEEDLGVDVVDGLAVQAVWQDAIAALDQVVHADADVTHQLKQGIEG